jgi:hypothetical protein
MWGGQGPYKDCRATYDDDDDDDGLHTSGLTYRKFYTRNRIVGRAYTKLFNRVSKNET